MVGELTGDEPNLQVGDSGEGVVLLQVRLYQLGYYRQMPDGTYDMTTENAVRELQSATGLDNDGQVTRETWEAIVHWEQQNGIQYQYQSPYDALAQLQYDLEHPESRSGDFPAGDASLSPDGQWRWDGNDWQPAGGGAGAGSTGVGSTGVGQLSEDGQWRWNGTEWVAAHDAGAAGAGSGSTGVGQLSEDGQWRWDGTQWQAATGDGYVGQLSEDGQWRWNGTDWVAV